MLKINLRLIFRNFKKNIGFSAINIIGLSFSFSAFMLIGIYIYFELNHENFISKRDRIARVSYKIERNANEVSHWARVPVNYINQLPEEIPEIEQLVRFQNHQQKFFKINEQKFVEDHVFQADKEVLTLFDYKMTSGNPETALASPKSIVLSSTTAKKFFGSEDVIGKEVKITTQWISEPETYKVTGVFEDLPSNTHLPVDVLISFANEEERTWWAYIYVLLNDGANIDKVNKAFEGFIAKHDTDEEVKTEFILQPLTEIHLNSNLAREIVPNGSIQNVKIFSVIAILILIIGLINFANLNSTIAIGHTKEYGVRKVLGASDRQVSASVFIEAIVYSLLALIIATAIIILLFPEFKNFTGVQFLIPIEQIGIFMISIAIITGILSGMYPSIIARRFSALHLIHHRILHSAFNHSNKFSLKKFMLTFQFIIAMLLIGGAFVASEQFSFIKQKNLSMRPEEVLAITRIPNGVKESYDVFKSRIQNIPGIKSFSACLEVPSREIRDAGPFQIPEIHATEDEAPVMDAQIIDHDFFRVMNLELLDGEFLPPYITSRKVPPFTEEYTYVDYLLEQERAYLINETAMKKLGYSHPQEIIGKQGKYIIGGMELAPGKIVGVIADYHQETFKNKIDPTVYVYEPLWLNTYLIRMNTQNMVASINSIEDVWNELFPNFPITYQFLDELYDQLYQKERKQLDLLYFFSILALFIAFLGIFGLVAYSLKTRIKELAIRKVLGANISTLIQLISKEYLIILIFGSIVAVPISYWSISLWLENFAYRINISVMSYLLAFTLVAILLLITLSLLTMKTARTNPSDILRNE